MKTGIFLSTIIAFLLIGCEKKQTVETEKGRQDSDSIANLLVGVWKGEWTQGNERISIHDSVLHEREWSHEDGAYVVFLPDGKCTVIDTDNEILNANWEYANDSVTIYGTAQKDSILSKIALTLSADADKMEVAYKETSVLDDTLYESVENITVKRISEWARH